MTGEQEETAPGLANARGLRNRFPDHFATGSMKDLTARLGIAHDDPQGNFLAAVYRLAARIERSGQEVGTWAYRAEIGRHLVHVRLLVLDQDDPHDFPDRLILSARERGLTALARSATNELNAARNSLQRLEDLRQGLFDVLREGEE